MTPPCEEDQIETTVRNALNGAVVVLVIVVVSCCLMDALASAKGKDGKVTDL
jgi:hypothetical protein